MHKLHLKPPSAYKMDSDLIDDLDDLGSDSEGYDDAPRNNAPSSSSDIGNEDGSDNDEEGREDDDDAAYNTESLMSLVRQNHSKSALGKLRRSERYVSHLAAIEAALLPGADSASVLSYAVMEESSDYKLVVASQRLLQELEVEKDGNIMRVADLYNPRFPELPQLVANKMAFVRAVQRIGNEADMNNVKLSDFLPNNIVMIISVSASSSTGAPLPAAALDSCMAACAEVLALEDDRLRILEFLESRVPHIAPNLCALIGAAVAAHLLGLAGGLVALSKIPACNVTAIGKDKRTLNGMSTASNRSPAGPLNACDIVQQCPASLRRKMLKVLAAKVTLAARIDSYAGKGKGNDAGEQGHSYRRDVLAKVEMWGKPDQARTKRALPVPTDAKKHKRGGKRARKMKERFAQTELGALRNRVSFTGSNDEYGDSAMGLDSGMLGKRGINGRVRAVQAVKKETHLSKKQKKAMSTGQGQSQVDGLSTSLAFTPVQGIELVNPKTAADKVIAANARWFGASSGFVSAVPR